MDRVLPGPIRNRVRYGFLKKKTRSGFGSGSGFIKKTREHFNQFLMTGSQMKMMGVVSQLWKINKNFVLI